MVFITAGMGGGTGTGAAPDHRQARPAEHNILTVGVVTKPFQFEGAPPDAGSRGRHRQELQQYVDTLIVIPNQNLFRIANEKTTFADAFKMADEVLHSGVRGVTDLIVMPGLINLDFADIRTVMSEMGKAMMGTGEADRARGGRSRARRGRDLQPPAGRGLAEGCPGHADQYYRRHGYRHCIEVDEVVNRVRSEIDPDCQCDLRLDPSTRRWKAACVCRSSRPEWMPRQLAVQRPPALEVIHGGGRSAACPVYCRPTFAPPTFVPRRYGARADNPAVEYQAASVRRCSSKLMADIRTVQPATGTDIAAPHVGGCRGLYPRRQRPPARTAQT